jgi:protein SCO1
MDHSLNTQRQIVSIGQCHHKVAPLASHSFQPKGTDTMFKRARTSIASPTPSRLGLVSVILLCGLPPASGESIPAGSAAAPIAIEPSAQQAADMHQYHHHPAPAGTKRSVASYPLPDLTMVDQNGKRVSLREALSPDEPVLLNFIFTSCTAICPVMSATFSQVQQDLGRDAGRIRMVSISIDPEQDTPSVLAAYAERFHAGPQWEFLTGTLEDGVAVQKAFDAYRGDKMSHAPLTLMRGTPNTQWVRFDGFASAADLLNEARAMLDKGHREAPEHDPG